MLALAGGGQARDLTEAENVALAETVRRFDGAMRSSDYAVVTATIPPRILAHIAKQAGVEVDDLRKIVIEQTKKALADVKLISFGMDLDKATREELADGQPYVLIPTETTLDAGAGPTTVTSHSLALLDGGAWYLLRVSDAQQVTILRQVYPEFVGVEFPPAGTQAAQP